MAHPTLVGPGTATRRHGGDARSPARSAPVTRPPHAAGSRAPEAIRPFLKWAGGKRQLLPELRQFYPREFGAYYEPFVGSGAVFFDLESLGLLRGRRVRLADVNPDVIGCYDALRSHLPELLRHLERLARGFARGGDAHYYDVRDRRFNPMRRTVLCGAADDHVRYPVALAAMLIYLNRTGFNGLFRLNSRGEFNVPAGRYTNPRICDQATLSAAAGVLARADVAVRHEPFEHVEALAERGDFLYLDPPYAPLNATSRFTAYTADGFSEDRQRELQRVVLSLAARGCHVLLSNSTAPLVRDLYEADEAKAVGLRVWRVRARRAINARASARGPIDELIITNLPRRRGRAVL